MKAIILFWLFFALTEAICRKSDIRSVIGGSSINLLTIRIAVGTTNALYDVAVGGSIAL